MVNYFITYCIFTSLFLILWYHGKIVVPGREHGVLIRILRFHAKGIGKMWILSFVLFFGFCVTLVRDPEVDPEISTSQRSKEITS